MGAVKARLMEMVDLVIKDLGMNDDRFEEIQDWVMDNFNLSSSSEELIRVAREKFGDKE